MNFIAEFIILLVYAATVKLIRNESQIFWVTAGYVALSALLNLTLGGPAVLNHFDIALFILLIKAPFLYFLFLLLYRKQDTIFTFLFLLIVGSVVVNLAANFVAGLLVGTLLGAHV